MVESVSMAGITIKAIRYLILGKYQKWYITMVEVNTLNLIYHIQVLSLDAEGLLGFHTKNDYFIATFFSNLFRNVALEFKSHYDLFF